MSSVLERVEMFKLVGELMRNPQKFKEQITFDVTENSADAVGGTFRMTGDLAELIRGKFNGKLALEETKKA